MTEERPVEVTVFDHRGHRLAYVAAVIEAASCCTVEPTERPTIVLSADAADSAEYRTHLEQLVDEGRAATRWDLDGSSLRHCLRSLRTSRERGAHVVFTDGDHMLVPVLIAWALRQLPRRVALLVLRPPGLRPGLRPNGVSKWIKALIKYAVLCATVLLSRLGSGRVRLLLLEDPLADDHDRIWSMWPLGSPRFRVNDPWDLMGDKERCPAELEGIADQPFISLLGSVDKRKPLPLVYQAWHETATEQLGRLVVAGKWTHDMRSSGRQDPPSRVVEIDRYLDDAELLFVLRHSRATFVLHDRGLSSGLLITSIAHGVPVIADPESRTGRVAAAHDALIPARLALPDVKVAICQAFEERPTQRHVRNGTRMDFGRRLYGAVVDDAGS